MQLVFTDKYLNLLLLLSGFVVLVFFYSKRKKKDRALKFGNYETLKKVAGRNFLKTSNLLVLTRVLAISALIIGISNPALVQEVRSPESDFVVALDSSASMFTSDIDPTRFKAAKQVSKSFVSKNPGNVEIGFVAFSGNVEKVVELTNKHGKVLSAIDSTGMGETGGTNIAEAISTSVSLLLGEQNKGKVILITDGENTAESSLNRSLDFAETHNISIYTIGIGSRNGSASYETIQGENISGAKFPNLDRDQLKRIANVTGGEASFVSNRSSLREAFLSIGKHKTRTELTTYFILFAAALLVIEWILRSTKWEVIP